MVVVCHTLRLDDGFRHGIFRHQPDDTTSWWFTVTPLRALFDGHVAVCLFFVLSGYVLSRRHWQGKSVRWGMFYASRVIRLYLPVFGSALCAVVMMGIRQEFLNTGNGLVDLEAAGTTVSHLIVSMALVTLADAPLNGVWWSMRWEVWFSLLVLPFLSLLGWIGWSRERRQKYSPLWLGFACIVLLVAAPWFQRVDALGFGLKQALLYLPMFGVGIAAAAFEDQIVARRWTRGGLRGWLALLGCLVLLGSEGAFGYWAAEGHLSSTVADAASNALSVTGAGLLIALILVWPGASAVLSTRPLQWVGTRSYSLYLVHLPLLHVLNAAFAMEGAPWWYVVFVAAASLLYSAVFFSLVEKPSIRLAGRVGRGRDRPRDLEPGPPRFEPTPELVAAH